MLQRIFSFAPAILCRINEILYHLCYEWLAEKPEILQQHLKPYGEYEQILSFVEKEGDARTTVGMLADMKRMRQDVFSRKFTREMGISPKEFITRVLVRKASLLLGETGIQVREVSRHLAFSSEYYFSRFFRQHTGLSPRMFQRNRT